MMRAVFIRSRWGNMLLAIAGGVYALAALVLLVPFLINTWNGAAVFDRAVQLGLLIVFITGLLFLQIAFRDLGIRLSWRRTGRAATAQ